MALDLGLAFKARDHFLEQRDHVAPIGAVGDEIALR